LQEMMADTEEQKSPEKASEASEDKAEAAEPEKVQGGDEEEEDEEDVVAWGWGQATSWMSSTVSSVSQVTNSAVAVAKAKSADVYGLVSKDLGEVGNQVGSAAGTVGQQVGSAAGTVKKTLEEFDDKTDEMADKAVDAVKKSVSSIWKYASGYATQMFTEEDLESEAIMVMGDDKNPVLLDRLQAQLHALASDPETFLKDPDARDNVDWETWSCDLDKRQGEISDLMVNNASVREHYKSMVPDQVSHKLFWKRYFFKVHLIELQEVRRNVLKKRAEEATKEAESGEGWGEESDLTGKDISAEEQDRLLSEYEREMMTKKMKKKSVVEDSIGEELAKLDMKDKKDKKEASTAASKGKKAVSPDKASSGSDDWEKLTSGEGSPRKGSRDDDDWVKT